MYCEVLQARAQCTARYCEVLQARAQCRLPLSSVQPLTAALCAAPRAAADSLGHRVVMDRKRCLLAYLRGWFLVDLMSTIPWDMVLTSDSAGILQILKVGGLSST
jgi:hypothetical protein